MFLCFFFNDTATTEIYTLSLHDALPICRGAGCRAGWPASGSGRRTGRGHSGAQTPEGSATPPPSAPAPGWTAAAPRSEEHTSELQSRQYLVCRLLLEKKKK